jgi:4-aminobutyrate aminotransferase/(S)-3-amino-2-methylpropionate transaminase
MDLPTTGNMSSTNSANPLSCSAGLAVLEEIDHKNLINGARLKGQLLHERLLKIKKKFPRLIDIYGKGLIAAIVFNKKYKNINNKLKKLAELCMQDGLLIVYTGRESVKIGPPLTISKKCHN